MKTACLVKLADSQPTAAEKLKELFTKPVLYIVVGGIVLLILIIWLLRKIVKARPGVTKVIIRNDKPYKFVNEKCPRYFMTPFKDKLGAFIPEGDQFFNSDQLFINDGPDKLYKISFRITFKVVDPSKYYYFVNGIEARLLEKLNESLRLYSEENGAELVIKNYRKNESKIVEIINKAVEEISIKVSEFKVKSIEPLGKK